MSSLNETPRRSQRSKKKVKYYEDFETTLDMSVNGPKSKKLKKDEEEETFQETASEDEKENEVSELNETEDISEYERMRLKNVEENRRIMMELGLLDPKKGQKLKVEETRPKPKYIQKKPPKVKQPTVPTKRSMRLLRKTPEGKDLPTPDIFQETPSNSPVIEEKARLMEEVLPMGEDGLSSDFLDNLKISLSQDSGISTLGSQSADSLIKDMRQLAFAAREKVTTSRIQSMCIHPLENKLLVVAGSMHGELGLWDVNNCEIARFSPHLRAINCVSVCVADQSKLFTTSHDGTLRRADINKNVFDMAYQTDDKRDMCHITWHAQVDSNTLLVAHGIGQTGVIDLRVKKSQRWFHCHPRSVRTVQPNPSQPQYFISSSGTGGSCIWDLRQSKKHVYNFVSDFPLPKNGRGLTSAFFSPDGKKVVSTCNDDYLRIYNTEDMTKPELSHSIMHDNHTGRWLSVFKAIWHPQNSDLIFVGSMLSPRRIQLYSSCGRLLKEINDDELSTVVPVIALHPTLPIVVGGNSSGKAHIFTTPSHISQFFKNNIKEEILVKDEK